MTPIDKVAVFLMLLGIKRGQAIIALMDNNEIKAVASAIRDLTTISQEVQERVWAEFLELGYREEMNSSEVLTKIRFLFHGTEICDET